MFSLAAILLSGGYALIYTGLANLRNGGNGPTLAESFGFKTAVAPPGSDHPNLTGQAPSPDAPPPGTVPAPGGTFA